MTRLILITFYDWNYWTSCYSLLVMELFDRLITRYGTVRAAARVLGLPEQRVYKWRLRGMPTKYNKLAQRLLNQREMS